ncbi:hypothetical protein O6H91_04G007900 [Diphasiastrum complanatum]|uniref:Uncharacterized protein n=1 Tax=Diphasiastrum complanatum TaxID=34168 RepID=A0ACC2DU65_DIPCM|nr:hypothetical protein O6H91_04G007900 [Diphasiastrum complanatum]
MASKDNWWLELKWGSEHSDLIQPMPCFKHELVDQQHAHYNSLHRAVCIPRLFHVPQQFGYQHGPAQLRTLQPCVSNAIYEVEELDRGKLVDASQDHSGHIKECNGSLKELEYASKCSSNYGNYARSCRTDESNITSNVGDENCRSISSALCGSCEDVKKLSHLAAVACEVDSPAKRKPLKLRTEVKKAVKVMSFSYNSYR